MDIPSGSSSWSVLARSAIAALEPRLRDIRHDIHQHPELGFEEHRTQELVRAFLHQYGYAPRACAGTGLVADLRPDLIGKTKTIGLRADLDCLPMHEETDLPYRSVHEGRAHKCGHDGHTAIMLGVAAVLAGVRDRVPGNVRLLFQPAEEGVRGGGAKVMVAEGALEGVDEVYGLHNWPAFGLGELRVKAGPMLAQTHGLQIDIHGVGGHGSQPQVCRDPIVAGAHIVSALQTVVSRGVGAMGGAVVSICTFQAGTANNVIPDRARLGGTVRTFLPEVTARVLERIREVVQGVGATFGVRTEVVLDAGYPVVMNDPECAAVVARVGRSVLGEQAVREDELPIAGGEDFAYMSQATRGAYFFLGTGNPERTTVGCHHPDFDFDDRILETGVHMFVGIVRDRLGD